MTTLSNKDISRIVYDAMDCLGYSEENIRRRAAMYRTFTEKMNNLIDLVEDIGNFRQDLICAGSRSEGVGQLLESDLDMMDVFRNFICVDKGRPENDITVIQTHMVGCPPGYTKLIPLDMDGDSFGSALLPFTTVYDLDKGHILLLNTCIKQLFRTSIRQLRHFYSGMDNNIQQISGPSIPFSTKYSFGGVFEVFNKHSVPLDCDFVIAMPYVSSAILETWEKRSRKYQWPSKDVIQEVATTEGFVVPVGHKCSEEQNFEWRICYTTAELNLVSHLSPVQLKFYILLKMIFKQVIDPKGDIITSYLVRNIVFWVCEGNDESIFTPEKLVDLIRLGLAFLLNCLHSNFFPNYMIPSRNLLLGKGNPGKKTKLRGILRGLLCEGGAILFRLRKVSVMTYVLSRNSELGKAYGKWRDNIEKVSIVFGRIVLDQLSQAMFFQQTFLFEVLFETFKHPSYLEVIFSLLKLLHIDFVQFLTDPVRSLKRVQVLLKQILS